MSTGSKKCLIERSLSPSSPIFFKPDKVGIVRYYDFLKTDVLRSASDRNSSKLMKLDKLRQARAIMSFGPSDGIDGKQRQFKRDCKTKDLTILSRSGCHSVCHMLQQAWSAT